MVPHCWQGLWASGALFQQFSQIGPRGVRAATVFRRPQSVQGSGLVRQARQRGEPVALWKQGRVLPQDVHSMVGGLRQLRQSGPSSVRAETARSRSQRMHFSWQAGSLSRQPLQSGAPAVSLPATGRVRPHHLQGWDVEWL